MTALALGACTPMDDVTLESGTLLSSQIKEINVANPERIDAQYIGMYVKLMEPKAVFGSSRSARPDDWGFGTIAFSGDLEAADMMASDNGYNWFSVCGELSSRNADYANPYMRYTHCYNVVSQANELMKSIPDDVTDPLLQAKLGQAYALRAFAYLNLAPYYQFRYIDHKDDPCVPLVTLETTDFTQNPRATVAKVYQLIIDDLTKAIEKMDGYTRPDKGKIDQQVAYGIRARAYLYMEEWQKALDDAQKAADGYVPASMAEVSKPAFMNISEHNWIWGYDMTTATASIFTAATSSAWLRSFSGDSYSAATENYARINNILYNKIPLTDVRHGWWLDEALYSPLLDGLSWGNVKGQDIATAVIGDAKKEMPPLTNVKFGCNPIGTTTNEEDWPFMRVEEMILIQVECLANLNHESEAKAMLTNFVQQYRDPQYNVDAGGRKFADEIWFQRRVELWGEGFANADTRRLNKPLVRFIDAATSNYPDAWRFNMPADDPWWLLRFATAELNTNLAIIDNEGGQPPVKDQNPGLRDGVTD